MKPKSKIVNMMCDKCFRAWMAIYVSGVVKREAICPGCGAIVKTAGAKVTVGNVPKRN
jgi:hypothetical protein